MTGLPSCTRLLPVLVVMSQPLAAQEALTPATNVIAGVVSDSEGAPLSGVTVILAERHEIRITEFDGTFRFTDVPPGAHTLQVRRIGYLPVTQQVVRPFGEILQLEIVMLRHPLLLEEIVVEAGSSGLSGVVHDPNMRPIPGAMVSAALTARRIRTGDDGWFQVPDFPAGRHLLRVSAEGYEAQFVSVIVPEDSARVVSIQLAPGSGALRGVAHTYWLDYSFNRRWASRAMTTMLTRDDLDRRAGASVLDIADVRTRAGTSPCVYLDGAPTFRSLDEFAAMDAEAVEVIPRYAMFLDRQPFSASRTGSRSMGAAGPRSACSSQVFIWLRSD